MIIHTTALRSAIREIAREFSARSRLRKAERALSAMPDSMLKDIGIGRGDIRRRVRGK